MNRVTRREFLSASSAAITAPLILPSGVLARAGRQGANDKIVLAAIGTGGMGTRVMQSMHRWQPVAAVCDVDENRAQDAASWIEDGADVYADYRRVLDRNDIDAVIIATPDHWHAVQTIHAIEAGKDVYVEKPISNTIGEGRAVVNAVKRHGAIVQIGSQGRSHEPFFRFCSFIRNEEIGAIDHVHCWHYENPVGPNTADEDPPPHLDWDMWLGPARWRPYNPAYCHSTFRWFMEFGGGNIRDRGAHMLSLVLWALGRDNDGPVRITGSGVPPDAGVYDNPITMDVTWEFKNPDLTVTWGQPGQVPMEDPPIGYGITYHGERNSVFHWGTADEANAGICDAVADYEPPEDGAQLYRSAHHHQNWLECIKTRQRPIMHAEAAHRAASLCILGNMAYLLGRPLDFDPVTERFHNDDQANRLLHNPGRGPWHV